ncbi:MAG: flagellar transcriptional regulator FlhC [Gallionellaceae bacterium]
MRNKSLVTEAYQIRMSVDLIELGARLQLLQEETALSRERLLKLYKEIKGNSPSKGMLPYSTDWFLSWAPNIHSSLFMGIHQFFTSNTSLTGVEALIKSYRLYLEQIGLSGDEPLLSITRAWFLIRFFDAKMMQLTDCTECGGHFVVHTQELCSDYVCGICRPPSRAGKSSSKKSAPAQCWH